ncbi:MAG: hypothetical protein K2W94_01945 [Alphaproteobacteria bacterium]|nr:hypothetical protein [Alphaproteobacteria bacterium]
MTSEIMPTDSIPEIWKPYLSEKGKTYSLDFAIGNKNYIGKGLGAHTIISFTGFIQTNMIHQLIHLSLTLPPIIQGQNMFTKKQGLKLLPNL